MIGFAAFVVSAVAAAVPHLVFGDRLDVMADFLLGSLTGGVAFVFTYYQLKKLVAGV